ncbi:DUF3995 domain-containing protein [Rhodococcus sp. OK302]|uniref:DUF3995 domain-containing protein n=1 Tax=Rhodococcus sp. OK302 TaxID=1882769 RepID=UPI000B93E01A|nr:DUF3995 domain-containing protein [Rhodococcus sp. OK302]OYD61244.1 uncharacterized protein DUF3995 [Rhodococcus sp. OK302]
MTPLPVFTSRSLGTKARIAGLTGSTAFAAAALVHTAWGLGSTWPMRTRADLADAVVGSNTMPDARACFAVVGLTAAAAALVAGGGGTGRTATVARVALATGVAARGVAGGRAATKVLGLDKPSPRFIRLDNMVYRPLCLGTATAILTAAAMYPGID